MTITDVIKWIIFETVESGVSCAVAGRYRPINSRVVFSNSRYSNDSTNFDLFDLFKSIDCFGGPAFDFPDGLALGVRVRVPDRGSGWIIFQERVAHTRGT